MEAGLHESATLADVDRDGALAEAVHELGGDTRAAFLRKGALVAGGGLALGAFPAGFAIAQGGVPKGDRKILNYALTLEYLEAAFYAEANAKGKLTGETAHFAQVVGAHEAAHVEALKKVLGAKAVAKPSFDFQGTTGSEKTFRKTAMVLEDTGVSAYQGQAPNIKTTAVLASAGAILAVEARHAAWIRDIIGGGQGVLPAPAAFSTAKSMTEVLAAVKATKFIKS